MIICECGRKVVIETNPRRNPHGRMGHRSLKDHDLCRQCYKKLIYKARAEQRHG